MAKYRCIIVVVAVDHDVVHRGNVFPLPVCPCTWLCEKFTSNFIKPYTIMDYQHGKNIFNFKVDPTQNGRMAAILDFLYNIFMWITQKHLWKVAF